MTITKLRPDFTLTQDRLDALRAIAPEAFADGKINRDALLEALGAFLEEDDQDTEHFGLFWPGKRQARRLASQPSAAALRPVPGEGINEETTRNIFIEGDNLQVLKLLQKSYAGRVKMIYIDPPYNTGNDFIYTDNFAQPVEEYLRATGQADEMGRVLVTNTKAGGRYHSNWLNMMYPRLRLARNLLRDDGVIFVSIDDHEVHNLRALMNEVFGEENFVVNVVWQKAYVSNMTARHISDTHDHILVFAKNTEMARFGRIARTQQQIDQFQNPDNDPRGPWKAENLSAGKYYAAGQFEITTPSGMRVKPPPGRYWRCNQEQYEKWLRDGRITFGKSGAGRPMLKKYLAEVGEGLTPNSWWDHKEYGSNKEASLALKELFDSDAVFDTPKPVKLVGKMLRISTREEDIVLDFFAGSCTTAQAVLELNREDEGQRKFIMVQIPEPTPGDSAAQRAGFDSIAEIGKERIRRVIQRMQAEDVGKWTTGRNTAEDLGFRVFKLDCSNYQAWRDFEGGDIAELQTFFDRFESPLAEGWKPADVLLEIMLMEGFPLDSTTEVLPEFTHNTVTRISSDLVTHRLMVCLDEEVHNETLTELALGEEDIFICLDSALTDEAKVRLEDGRRVKVI